MRVLHVIPGIAPRYGGPSTAILPMTEALNRLPGISAEIATTDADGAGARLFPGSLPPTATPLHLFRRDFSERWKFSAGLWRWLARHAGEYDLLHVHALWSFSTLAACAAGRRRGVPIVLRPCGMLSRYTWGRSAWTKRLYWAAIERRNLSSVCCFHVTSRDEARELACLGWPAAAAIIPQGVNVAAWQVEPQPNALRERCKGRAVERPIILFLSRLHPKKGILDFLLPAFACLKTDAFLAIAGGVDGHAPGHELEIRATVERLGLSDRVALLGAVAPQERWSLFDGAALFVLPSRSENFGMVVTEAMARGLPVVVSQEVQAAEHVTAAGAGRVVPLQVGALAASMDELLGDPAVCLTLGERGRKYVRDNLTWERVAGAISGMYRSCLSRPGCAASRN